MPHSTPSFPCGYTGCTSWYLSCSQPRLLKVPLSLQIHQEPLQGMCLSIPNVAWPWNPATSLLHRGSGEAGLISLGGFEPFLESQPSDLWQVLPHQRRGPLHHLWGHSCHKHQKLWDRG